jgi:hypothetical protein
MTRELRKRRYGSLYGDAEKWNRFYDRFWFIVTAPDFHVRSSLSTAITPSSSVDNYVSQVYQVTESQRKSNRRRKPMYTVKMRSEYEPVKFITKVVAEAGLPTLPSD